MKDMKSFLTTKFSKAEKSDIPGGWPAEAVPIEEMVDELRKAANDINKKISSGIPSLGLADPDKRLKKIPDSNVVLAFTQCKERFETCKPELSKVFDSIGVTTSKLAVSRRDLELDMENRVLGPLKQLADEQLPAIQKERKQLSKYCLESKSANERLRSSENQIQTANPTSSNAQAAAAKIQQLRVAQEEAEQRAIQQKEQTLKALFHFDSQSRENASNLLLYLELQAQYFQQCSEILQEAIPRIKTEIETITAYVRPAEHMVSPVFRSPLADHLVETKREISYVLELCIKALNKEDALKEEGIFRTAGSKTKVDTLTHALDTMRANSLIFECEYSVVADALKQYFRFMEEPLLVSSLYDEWMAAMQQQSHNDRLQGLWTVLYKMPKGNIDNLRYLIKFLAKVSKYSEYNKMTPSNLGIVFGPNLLKSRKSSDKDPIGMMSTSVQSHIVEIMIMNADWFFPEEMFTSFTEDLPAKNDSASKTFVVSPSSGGYVNQINAAAIDAAAAHENSNDGGEHGENNLSPTITKTHLRHSSMSASFSPGSSAPRKPLRKNPAPPPPSQGRNLSPGSSDDTSYTKSMPSVLHVSPASSPNNLDAEMNTAHLKTRPQSMRCRPMKSSTLPPPRPSSMPPVDPIAPSRPPRPTHAPPDIPRSSLPSASEEKDNEEPIYDDLDSATESENTYL